MCVFTRSRPLPRSTTAFTMVIAIMSVTGCGSAAQPPSANVPVTPTIASPVEDVTAVANMAPPVQTVVAYWSTPSPRPTDSPPTLTASASMTVIPVPTEIPGLEETIVARATASPYPTAEPPVIQEGEPYMVSVRRGDIYYEMRLAGDSYLAGENGQATITVRNDGKDTLFLEGNRLLLLDERGNIVGDWPVGGWPSSGWPRASGPPSLSRPLAPGGIGTETCHFQLPSSEESKGHTYSLSVSTGLSRGMPTHPDRSDRISVPVELGPIPLKLNMPRPDQYLKAAWEADAKGYTLRVTDGLGKPVEGAWSLLVAYFSNGFSASPVRESSNGVWSDVWPEAMGTPLRAEAWVGARGYVAVGIKEAVSGSR